MALLTKLYHPYNKSANYNNETCESPPYSLQCADGRVMRFHLHSMAKLYQSLLGGTISHN